MTAGLVAGAGGPVPDERTRPRLVVVGSGIAGLIVAIRASTTHEVTLITKAELGESNTRYAQGGIAAAVFPDDTVASHVADTLAAGAGLNRPDAVEVLCGEGPQRIRDLIALGVEFDRAALEREAGSADPVAGLARGLEAAHGFARILHAGGDATGAAVETALVRAVRRTATRILEDTFVADLLVEGGRVVGVAVVDASGVGSSIRSDAVVLASGGAGQLYSHTTNPRVTTGDGVAAAYRAGAELSDLEFFQFHPTSMDLPGNFLVSEAVRGEGAVLRGENGDRFMLSVHPDAELAPRDVVARAIGRQMAEQGGRPVLLDATGLEPGFFAARFPSITEECRLGGIDPATQPIPVTPAAHYWMGGVTTDTWGRTSMPGLYAVGEVACTGVHGANRLASNSLLESVVFAWRAVEALQGAGGGGWDGVGAGVGAGAGAEVCASGEEASASEEEGSPTVPDARRPFSRDALQQLMWNAVGVYRDGRTLRSAVRRLTAWEAERAADPESEATPGRPFAALEDTNLLLLGRLAAEAALERRESRGAHFRTDHPQARAAFERHLTATPADHRTREVLSAS